MTLNAASMEHVVATRRADWTLKALLSTPAAELDDIFRASSQLATSRIPTGDTKGLAILGGSSVPRNFWAGIARLFCWQGKVFDLQNEDHATLVNKILPLGLKAIKAKVYRGPSRLDGQECIILDYSKTSLSAQWIRDEIREISPGVYLGLVYWGSMQRPMLRFALEQS